VYDLNQLLLVLLNLLEKLFKHLTSKLNLFIYYFYNIANLGKLHYQFGIPLFTILSGFELLNFPG